MSYFVVIPARFDSSRLPGKPLMDIAGKPMIQHVYENSRKSSAKEVVVATDDSRILDCVEKFGGRAILTAKSHTSGTERVQEAAEILDLCSDDIVVNVQGDEPLMPPEAIDRVATDLNERKDFDIATLCESSNKDIENPNIVKVVLNNFGEALYFSRAPIPHSVDANDYFRHIGLYAYRVDILNKLTAFPIAHYEKLERLEQLRALAFGIKIYVAVSDFSIPPGIDTLEDLEAVIALVS